jgi:hypothetical protein
MEKSKGGPSLKRRLVNTSSKHILDVPQEQPNVDDPKITKQITKKSKLVLQVIKTQVPLLVV